MSIHKDGYYLHLIKMSIIYFFNASGRNVFRARGKRRRRIARATRPDPRLTLTKGAWRAGYLARNILKMDLMEYLHVGNNTLFDRVDRQLDYFRLPAWVELRLLTMSMD